MTRYKWTRSEPFRDHANGREVAEGEVVDLPEAVAGPHRGFEAVETDADPEGGDGETPLKEKDYNELRQMAADADTDEVDGKSSKDEIVAYFSDE